jgi:formylglycine-generating enzyme required for sulfatase activity
MYNAKMRTILSFTTLLSLSTVCYAQQPDNCLQVRCLPGYEVCLDGRIVGTSKDAQDGLLLFDLDPGAHRLKVSGPGKLSEIKYVDIDSTEVKVVDVELRDFTNRLSIQTIPLNCDISFGSSDSLEPKSIDHLIKYDLEVGPRTVTFMALGKKVECKINITSQSDVSIFANLFTGEVVTADSSGARLPKGDWTVVDRTLAGNGWPRKILDNLSGVTFILVDGGEFNMGEPSSSNGDRGPVHTVEVDSYYLAETEMTENQWERSLGDYGLGITGGFVMRSSGGPDYAMQGVSHDDCTLMLESLGPGYRLPTEAEWEYACRGGTTQQRFYDYDQNSLVEYAWYEDNAAFMVHKVATKLPNPWGFYDMYGNVWEWCSDSYLKDYYKKSPKQNPQGPKHGGHKVLRGGAWFSPKQHLTSAYRAHKHSTVRGGVYADFVSLGNYGLRLAFDVPN